ncbi:MAG: hypothetical protein M3220_20810 [Chloroflexota bacterium]|nr:hypothetical protein [Chloroflexota bacterium]
MLTSLFPAITLGRSPQLPQRRWRIRASHVLLWGVVGALVGGAVLFIAWWNGWLPLWPAVLPMLLGGLITLPPPLVLGVDDRGVALLIPGWTKDRYLWIPRDRLVQLEIRKGWLLATGVDIKQQGELSWQDAARLAGAAEPPTWVHLRAQSTADAISIAAPIYLLDPLAQDEIELWMYRQGR